jgi:hypothetical protein
MIIEAAKRDKAGHIFSIYLDRFGVEMNGVELKDILRISS